MKNRHVLFLMSMGLIVASCQLDDNKNVISQRYIHKYGYDVSRDEWHAQQYPGQVLTTMRDGMTITESYEDGLLHGSKTISYPHSQTVKILENYEKGKLTKRVTYSIRGVPQQEEVFKSPIHVLVTAWYPSGTPKLKEEYKENVLVNGQYFTVSNETDSRIENGTGEKTVRNHSGDLLAKEIFNNYGVTYIETYYPNNMPHTATSYEDGKMHGDHKIFAMTGEPISVESYQKGQLHGLCTYFQNGYKYLETPYAHGFKSGVEKHYIDGESIAEETEYVDGVKHGSSVIYVDGSAKTTWYFENQKVSHSKFDELVQREQMIMTMGR